MNILARLGNSLADALIPRVVTAITNELDRHLPALTAALVTAVTEAIAATAAIGVDRLTDAIPGQLDDQILDPIVARALEIFRSLTHG